MQRLYNAHKTSKQQHLSTQKHKHTCQTNTQMWLAVMAKQTAPAPTHYNENTINTPWQTPY